MATNTAIEIDRGVAALLLPLLLPSLRYTKLAADFLHNVFATFTPQQQISRFHSLSKQPIHTTKSCHLHS
jgi:hypothetical protein